MHHAVSTNLAPSVHRAPTNYCSEGIQVEIERRMPQRCRGKQAIQPKCNPTSVQNSRRNEKNLRYFPNECRAKREECKIILLPQQSQLQGQDESCA